MSIVKKRNEQTESRLLLEDDEPVELPPAEIEESAIVAQFDSFKPFIPELVDALRAGTVAEPVPVMLDGSTFAVHGATRTFWVKLWHSSDELTRIERAQVISCLPSTRGVRVIARMDDEADDYLDEDDFDDDTDDASSIEMSGDEEADEDVEDERNARDAGR